MKKRRSLSKITWGPTQQKTLRFLHAICISRVDKSRKLPWLGCVACVVIIYFVWWIPGPDRSVVIATHYGLEDPGIESRCEAIFSPPVQTDPGANPASQTMGTGSFPGVKRQRLGINHPFPCSAEVKERVELYLYSPYGPSCPVLVWTLPLPLPLPLLLPLCGEH
jgi:hypothetical protein